MFGGGEWKLGPDVWVVEQIHRSVLAWASLLQSQGREPCENTATMVMRGMRNLQQRAVKALLEGPDDW